MDSIIHKKEIDPEDTMKNFMKWEFDGDYTPFGQAFDQGNTCSSAIWKFRDTADYRTCGKTGEYANGNGALMRILPVCLFYIEDETKQKARISGNDLPVQNTARNHSANSDQDYNSKAIQGIHTSSGLTHNHLRSQMACGLYSNLSLKTSYIT